MLHAQTGHNDEPNDDPVLPGPPVPVVPAPLPTEPKGLVVASGADGEPVVPRETVVPKEAVEPREAVVPSSVPSPTSVCATPSPHHATRGD